MSKTIVNRHMKTLAEYITESNNGRRHFKAPEEYDEWTNNCFDALKDRFKSRYEIDQKFSGSICLYLKGKKPSLKNLVCCINGIDNNGLLADFGPNTGLRNTLEKEIYNVIVTA